MAAPDITSLEPSELGTREYWDNVYARELNNHANDAEDEGTVWFDENSAEDTVIDLLDSLAERGELDKESSRILDLGTGNGHMLFALREDWQGEMLGVDYSPASIDLAKQIAVQREIEPEIKFEVWDILLESPSAWLGEGFDLVLDKGTFDAISLMQQGETHSCDRYFEQVAQLIRPGGLLVITSCNWTKQELLSWLGKTSLTFLEEAKYPTFSFGGVTGSSIVTIVVRRETL